MTRWFASAIAVVTLLLCISSVHGQRPFFYLNSDAALINCPNPYWDSVNSEGFSGPDTGVTSGGSSIGIPLNLANYNQITIEFWFLWAQSELNVGNQSLFFYGVDANNYVSIYGRNPGPRGSHTQFFVNIVQNGNSIVQQLNSSGDPFFFWTGLSLRWSTTSVIVSLYRKEGGAAVTTPFTAPSAPNLIGGSANSMAYIGCMPSGVARPAWLTKAANARVAEIRIHNLSVPPMHATTYFGNLPSTLTHFYRLRGGSSANAVSGGPSLTLSAVTVLTAVADQDAGAFDDRIVAPDINRAEVRLNGDQSNLASASSIPFFVVSSSVSSVTFGATNTSGTVSIGGGPTALYPNGTTFSISGFTRAACNRTTTVIVSTAEPSNNTVVVLVSAPSSAITSTTLSTTTPGGQISIAGSSLGVAGSFAPPQDAFVSVSGNFVCNSPTVTATNIQCNVAPGYGTHTFRVRLCDQVLSQLVTFSYAAPTIDTIGIVAANSIEINGTNFGPTPWSLSDRNVTITDIASGTVNVCVVSPLSHTRLTCNITNNLTLDRQYRITASIGGSVVTEDFEFSYCNPICANGPCVPDGAGYKCDCEGLPFVGDACSEPANCPGGCGDNGQCVASGAVTSCRCDDGWQGADCSLSTEVSPPLATGAIVGIAVGIFVVILILVIVIIILARRAPSRYKSQNYVPVEKKDFTKIIYGEQLEESVDKKSGDLDALEKLLVSEPSLDTVFALNKITAITEADKIAKALVIIFEANGKTMELLKAFTTDEVKNTDSAANLFRSNSMVSKMFKFYSRLIGLPYLYSTVAPEIYEIVEKEELHLEVDPEKLEEGSDLDEMRWTLMAESQKILKQIFKSVAEIPSPFAELMNHVKGTVAPKFADNVDTTVGGFIFLRFFCPAISSPEAYGIVDEPPAANARRLLILITKVLQNLSNDVEFGSKEPYMTKMNDFIITNRPKIAQFYGDMDKARGRAFPSPNLPKNMKGVSLAVISDHFRTNFDKIESKELKQQLDPIIKKD